MTSWSFFWQTITVGSVLTFIPPCCVIYRWSDDPIVAEPVTRHLLPGQQPNKWLSSPVSIISTISPAGNLRCSSSSLLSSSSSPHNQFQTKQHSPNWPSPYTNQTVPSVVSQWNCKNRDSQVLDKIICKCTNFLTVFTFASFFCLLCCIEYLNFPIHPQHLHFGWVWG